MSIKKNTFSLPYYLFEILAPHIPKIWIGMRTRLLK